MLGEQPKILSELELDFELETIGFEVPEIDLLIDGLNTVPETDPDDRASALGYRGDGSWRSVAIGQTSRALWQLTRRRQL
jgi:hypothetical protein